MTMRSYDTLSPLSGFAIPVYTSPSVAAHAQQLAQRFVYAYTYLTTLLEIPLDVQLALLSQQDWPHYVSMPFYGVAMYDHAQQTVVSGAEPTTFWEPILEQLHSTAPELLTPLRSVYTTSQGNLDLTPHVELWMIHDLGHACHAHHDYWFPRKWLMELFATLCLYTYVADQEPELLPIMETFFLVFHALPPLLVAHPTLTDFETHYITLPLDNYLWFSGHFMQVARALYRERGPRALVQLWKLFVLDRMADVSDAELIQWVQNVDPDLATLLGAFQDQYTADADT